MKFFRIANLFWHLPIIFFGINTKDQNSNSHLDAEIHLKQVQQFGSSVVDLLVTWLIITDKLTRFWFATKRKMCVQLLDTNTFLWQFANRTDTLWHVHVMPPTFPTKLIDMRLNFWQVIFPMSYQLCWSSILKKFGFCISAYLHVDYREGFTQITWDFFTPCLPVDWQYLVYHVHVHVCPCKSDLNSSSCSVPTLSSF